MSASTVRVPEELYQTLRGIRLSLEKEHQSAAPTIQDFVTVAIKRLIEDWNQTEYQQKIIEDLLKNRKIARSRMGKN